MKSKREINMVVSYVKEMSVMIRNKGAIFGRLGDLAPSPLKVFHYYYYIIDIYRVLCYNTYLNKKSGTPQVKSWNCSYTIRNTI